MASNWNRRQLVKAGVAAGLGTLGTPASAPAVVGARSKPRPVPFKIPGRCGASPIIGAGLYVDNEVGACGSTGRGEANLVECASFLVVELMRHGAHPKDAALAALARIADKTAPRLLTDRGRPNFNLSFYCLNKAGEYAGASMYGEQRGRAARFAVNDGGESRHEDCAALFETMS